MGVDYLVDIPFTEAIMTMEPETFVKNLLVDAIRAKELFCGFNYHFGYRGKGDVQELRILGSRYGFHVNAMPAVTVDGDVVSSTLIRGLIMAGEMDECANSSDAITTSAEKSWSATVWQEHRVSDLQYHD